jgi:hypothetical protein
MKSILLLFMIAALLFPIPAASQSIIKCNEKVVFWIIPDNNIYYTVKLTGDIDLSPQEDVLNIDDKALQYILINKNIYNEADGDNSEQILLSRYVNGEDLYLHSIFTDLGDIDSEYIDLPTGKKALLWCFTLPKGKNKEVIAQYFVNIIINDTIFGLGCPQFAEQDAKSTKQLLIKAIETVKTVTNTDDLCNK